MDGTFSNFEKAKNNVERSLIKNREVVVFYIYQNPEISWNFTQAREKIEGRKISEDIFIKGFINSRDNVKRIKGYFNEKVKVIIINKNFRMDSVNSVVELEDANVFERHVEKWYTESDIIEIIRRQ